MTKTKRNQNININKVNTTIAQLKELEAKPKLELTLRETIAEMEVDLKSAINKGYTYQYLSDFLVKQEILISAGTLKQYMSELNKSSSSRQKKKSTQKKSNVSQASLKLVSKDSNNNSAKESLSKRESKNEGSLKEKAISILNADLKINSDNNDKEPVKDKKTLVEKFRDQSYFDEEEEELRREFNQY
jgi:hypothetical protein